MKILSNFDTNKAHKVYQEAVSEHGRDKVLFVRRHFIYVVLKVLLPLLVLVIIAGGLLFVGYGLLQGDGGGLFTFVRRLIRSAIIVCGLYFFGVTVKKSMDFYMDYTIITPYQIACYNQSFIFRTSVRTLDISKIKSIRVDQEGLLKSIFNYGSIVFFAEGDQSGQMGDITLFYIMNPNRLKDRIDDLTRTHLESFIVAEQAIQQVAEKVVEQNDHQEQLAAAASIPGSTQGGEEAIQQTPGQPIEQLVQEVQPPQQLIETEPNFDQPIPEYHDENVDEDVVKHPHPNPVHYPDED